MMRIAMLALVGLTACATEEPPSPLLEGQVADPPGREQAIQAQAADAPAPQPPKLDGMGTTATVLAPSPLELQTAVKNAGVADSLAALIPARDFDMGIPDKDRVAIQTGVMVADCVLSPEDMPKEHFLGRMRKVREGLGALGADKELLDTVDGMIDRVTNDVASRTEILREVDEISGTLMPEEGWGPGDTTGPLLQAGAWLEGTNLVAQSIVASKNAEATHLLKQKQVSEYFLRYIKSEGADKGSESAVQKMSATLADLSEIAGQEQLSLEDAQRVATATGELLSML